MSFPPTQETVIPENPQKKTSRWLLVGILAGIGALVLCAILALVLANVVIWNFTRSGTAPLHGVKVTFQAQTSSGDQPSAENMQEAVKTLVARAKALGIKKYSFEISGTDQITARLPKEAKLDQSIQTLTQLGLIEFVDMGSDNLPDGSVITTDFSPSSQAPSDAKVRHTILSGEQIRSAGLTTDQQGKYLISFELDEKGKSILYEFSKNNIGKYLAITLDKKIITNPSINSPIPEGRAIIEGNFTQESATNLVTLLKTKALPFELKLIEIIDY